MRGSLPIFALIKDKKCLVIGGGEIATRKVKTLLEYTDKISVISPEISSDIGAFEKAGKVEWIQRSYKKGDLKDCFLTVAATDSKTINESVAKEADELGVLLNVVDVPELCNFYAGSIVIKGDMQIAISTSGKSPAFSKLMRKYLEKKLSGFDERMILRIQELRVELKRRYPNDINKRMETMNTVVEKIDLDKDDVNTLEELIKRVVK